MQYTLRVSLTSPLEYFEESGLLSSFPIIVSSASDRKVGTDV